MSKSRELKDFTRLQFSDDFMFGIVMRNEKICKRILEIILDLKISQITYPEGQKSIDMTVAAKSIRLDVFVIFICTDDPFGRDAYVYTFENRCVQMPDLALGDDAIKIFLNAGGLKGKIGQELKGLEKGIEEGLERGIVKTLISLVLDGVLTNEQAAERAGLSLEEFLQKKRSTW